MGLRRQGALLWADLIRRTFGFDVLARPRCGGCIRLVALIEEARVIQRIATASRPAHRNPRAASHVSPGGRTTPTFAETMMSPHSTSVRDAERRGETRGVRPAGTGRRVGAELLAVDKASA